MGNPPGQRVLTELMGRPLPGYDVVLVDPVGGDVRPDGPAEGEVCLRLDPPELGPPQAGSMVGYRDDEERTADQMRGGVYHTGDVASRDADGYVFYVGRADDVFKASDSRISPFELGERSSWSTPRWPKRRWSRRRTHCGSPCRRPSSCSRPAGSRPRRRRSMDLAYAREHLRPVKRIRRLEFIFFFEPISGKMPGAWNCGPTSSAATPTARATGWEDEPALIMHVARTCGPAPGCARCAADALHDQRKGGAVQTSPPQSASCGREILCLCTTAPVCAARPASVMCPATMPTW